MSKKVVFARFHASIHIPGIGEIGMNLPKMGYTIHNLAMNLEENGSLLVRWGDGESVTVGAANILVATHPKEEPPKPVVKK